MCIRAEPGLKSNLALGAIIQIMNLDTGENSGVALVLIHQYTAVSQCNILFAASIWLPGTFELHTRRSVTYRKH